MAVVNAFMTNFSVSSLLSATHLLELLHFNFRFNVIQQSGSSYPLSLLKRESVGMDYIIESVDSINRDGPVAPIHYKVKISREQYTFITSNTRWQ